MSEGTLSDVEAQMLDLKCEDDHICGIFPVFIKYKGGMFPVFIKYKGGMFPVFIKY